MDDGIAQDHIPEGDDSSEEANYPHLLIIHHCERLCEITDIVACLIPDCCTLWFTGHFEK